MGKSNRARRGRKRSTRGGKLSKCFDPKSGTRGLWSVSIENRLPSTYIENFSQAQVMASASFSIWAYLRSVSDNERDVYAIGFHCESVFCSKTAPSPYAEILDSFCTSNRARVVGLDNSSFTCENACS